MVDLRKYEDLIREQIGYVDHRDKNWKWSVKSIGKSKVRIRWSYLDYLEAEPNCFFIEVQNETDGEGDWIWAIDQDGSRIDCWCVAEHPNPKVGCEMTIPGGIRCAIEEIEYYAHSRY